MTKVVIYVKQHLSTGLLYLGKTSKDPYKYKGSGTYWKRHCNTYGSDKIHTVWVSPQFEHDDPQLHQFAMEISTRLGVTQSKLWANLIDEKGTEGGVTREHLSAEVITKLQNASRRKAADPEFRQKLSNALKGKPKSEEFKAKVRGKPKSVEHRQKLSMTKQRENSPFAKTYTFIDPIGNEHCVKGSFNDFCKTHNLSWAVMKNNVNCGVIQISPTNNYRNRPAVKSCNGWSVQWIDDGRHAKYIKPGKCGLTSTTAIINIITSPSGKIDIFAGHDLTEYCKMHEIAKATLYKYRNSGIIQQHFQKFITPKELNCIGWELKRIDKSHIDFEHYKQILYNTISSDNDVC